MGLINQQTSRFGAPHCRGFTGQVWLPHSCRRWGVARGLSQAVQRWRRSDAPWSWLVVVERCRGRCIQGPSLWSYQKRWEDPPCLMAKSTINPPCLMAKSTINSPFSMGKSTIFYVAKCLFTRGLPIGKAINGESLGEGKTHAFVARQTVCDIEHGDLVRGFSH